jgi:nucleoside-diphosphate-sugar epimerase
MSRQVVFGTGQVGRLLATRLGELGHDVVAVNSSGRGVADDVRTVAGDATDTAFTSKVADGADVVYFCLNPASYGRWAQEFPPLQRGVLHGAQTAGARLVVLDNLYSYSPAAGPALSETSPVAPASAKAAVRAAMTRELLDADRAGRVQVAIGRASDFFGPGSRLSALGDSVFGAALTGRTAQVMGNPDLAHSYSFTPDVADALITLGTRDGSTGSVWHLPVATPRTTREIVTAVYTLAGHRARVVAAGSTTLRIAGMVKPGLREYLHTLYQFTDAWIVDDSRFRARFGAAATDLDAALGTTLEWYRQQRDAKPVAAENDSELR